MKKCEIIKKIQTLKFDGYIRYGGVIPVSILEGVLGVSFSDGWEWRGPMLELRKGLTEMGYFVSERGCDDGDIRFLREDEIPEHLHNRRLKRYERMHTDLTAAIRVPIKSLSDKQIKRLEYEQDRLSRDINTLAEQDPEIKELFFED